MSSHEDIVIRESIVGGLEERGCGHDMGVRKSKQLVATRLLLMGKFECTYVMHPRISFRLPRGPDDQLSRDLPNAEMVSQRGSTAYSESVLG